MEVEKIITIGLEVAFLVLLIVASIDYNPKYFLDKHVMKSAMDANNETNLDFADCVLSGYSCIKENVVFTFDKKLRRYLKEKRQ